MKKLFMIVSTPYWMVNLESTPRLSLEPPPNMEQLQDECREFESLAETDPASLDFARRAGSRGGRFEMRFVVAGEPEPVPGISLTAEISGMKNPELIPAGNSLSLKSAGLGLPSAGLLTESINGETVLKAAGRDLACDLLNQRAELKVLMPLQLGPDGEAILNLNEKLGRIEKIILETRREEPNPALAAALLGYRLQPDELRLVFAELVNEKNLELSANWETFGNQQLIRYEKSKPAGLVPVLLRVASTDEKKVNALDRKIAGFSALKIENFTVQQRAEFNELNRQKSALLQKIIRNKLKRGKHVF